MSGGDCSLASGVAVSLDSVSVTESAEARDPLRLRFLVGARGSEQGLSLITQRRHLSGHTLDSGSHYNPMY